MQWNPTYYREGLREYVVRHAKSTYARYWLAALSFAEASFFPVPPDVLLIAILIVNSTRWFMYAFVTTLFSVLGALFGYLIGALFFEYIGTGLVSLYGLEDQMTHVGSLFAEHTFMTMFLAAFTPIPFKVFAIAGGLFKVPLAVFIIASFLGRGIRFFTIGFFLKLYGKQVGGIIYTYFNAITGILLIAILTLFIISFYG